MDKEKQVFTVEEVAELLSCHGNTVRKMIREGKLEAAKIGADSRISRADLVAYWAKAGGKNLFSEQEERAYFMKMEIADVGDVMNEDGWESTSLDGVYVNPQNDSVGMLIKDTPNMFVFRIPAARKG
ncbi:MAG: helix-turn-helix domain-containing protein [Syntrophobacter sp.]